MLYFFKNQRGVYASECKVVVHADIKRFIGGLVHDVVEPGKPGVRCIEVFRVRHKAFIHHTDRDYGFENAACAQGMPDIALEGAYRDFIAEHLEYGFGLGRIPHIGGSGMGIDMSDLHQEKARRL